MAYFAEIKDNIVQRVIAVHDNELLVDGVEIESKGIEFCQSLFGGEWVQTSFNTHLTAEGESKHREGKTPFRNKYAAIGDIWDPISQKFLSSE